MSDSHSNSTELQSSNGESRLCSISCDQIHLLASVVYKKYRRYVSACDIYVRSIQPVTTALQHNMLSVRTLYLRSQHLICPKLYWGSQILQHNPRFKTIDSYAFEFVSPCLSRSNYAPCTGLVRMFANTFSVPKCCRTTSPSFCFSVSQKYRMWI